MKKNWWRSLRTKIIAWSFIPTVIILSAVAWFTFFSYQKVIGDLAIKQFPKITQPKAIEFTQTLNGILNPILVPILLNIDTNHELPLEIRVQNILDQAPGLEIFDGGIFILDQQGKVIITQPPQPELIGQDWSDSPHFRSVHAEPNVGAWTDLITVGSSGKKVFCAAMALTGQTWDEVLGAIYYCFTVYPASENTFYQKITLLDLGAKVYVVDRNQQIVYSPDPSEMGQDLSQEVYIQQLSLAESNSGRFRIGTEDMVVSYIPVFSGVRPDRASWFMLSEQPWREIIQPSLPYQEFLLVLLTLGVILPVLVTTYGVRYITDPIEKLIQAAKQVTAGDFKHRIDVKTGDEIETLADQFNLMSAELDDSYTLLEKKVADRTRELAILNAIISVASHSLNIQEILENALNNAADQMSFAAGAAFRLEGDSVSPVLVAQRGFEPSLAVDLMNKYVTSIQGTLAFPEEVVSFGIEVFQDEGLKDGLVELGLQMLVYVPLSTKGRQQGFFILGKSMSVNFSPEELSLLDSIGKQVGVAMENALLYEQAEQSAISAERNRLARELHDAVTQTLFSASLIGDVLPKIWERNPEEGLRILEELRQLTRGALAEMRTLLLEMRPETLERVDIKTLLTQLSDAFVGRVRIPVNQVIKGDCQLDHEVKLVFYRVAQEALNNISKHAGARQVEIHLVCQTDQINLLIKDDGLGFDLHAVTPDHLGIAIMRERANSIRAGLKIDSQLGQGTTVELDWRSAWKDE